MDPLAQGSQSGETAPTIVTSVQSLNRNHQQQTHQLVASTSIVQLTLPSSAATQVYRTATPVYPCSVFSLRFFFFFFFFVTLLPIFSPTIRDCNVNDQINIFSNCLYHELFCSKHALQQTAIGTVQEPRYFCIMLVLVFFLVHIGKLLTSSS